MRARWPPCRRCVSACRGRRRSKPIALRSFRASPRRPNLHTRRYERRAGALTAAQACESEVALVNDHIEVGKRQAQEKDVLALRQSSDDGEASGLQWFNAAFDESGLALVFPSWRGIVVGDIGTGQVIRACAVALGLTASTCALRSRSGPACHIFASVRARLTQ